MYDVDSGLGAAARGRRKGGKRKKARARRGAGGCKTVVFKRRKRGGKVLPRSQWTEVRRCPGRKLRATNPKQCKNKTTGRYVKCGTSGARRRRRRK